MKYHDSPCPQCGRPVPDQAQEGLCPRCALAAVASPTEPAPDPAGLRPPPSPEKLAAALPQFEIVRLIGQGGMASVFQARQPQLNRFVALKILQLGDEPDPVFAERFAREAQALAALSHPNIVTIHDFGQAKGFYYLVMEYVDGVSLRALLREGRLEPETALGIVPKICEALEFAHERGVVHRDIKPENILLDKSGRVKIADFGIAKMMGESFVASSGEAGRGETSPLAVPPESLRLTEGQVLGTPSYMAPEQVTQPQQTDHRADIYSLGVVFYEMLTGELPVGQFPPPSVKVQLDVRLDQVVLRALEKTPQRRYQHVSEVRSEVETITGAGGAPIAGPPGPRFPLWFESEGRRRLHWPGVMALVSQVGLTVIAVVSLLAFVLWLFGAPARITFTRGEILLLAPLAVLCIIMYWAARAAPRVMPREDRTGTAPARKTRLATALLALLTALVVAIVVTPATVTFLTITALRWFQQQRPSPAAVPDAGSSESSAGTPALSRPVSADPTPSPIEFTVAPDGAGAYESIQRALDAAPEGATVRIVAGRYDESLQITKSVALVGAGWQRTVIGPIKPEPPPNAETLRELERRVRSAPTDAERERLREEARAQFTPPVIRIEAAADARFEGLQFHQPGTPAEGKLVDSAAIEVLAGSAHFDACAMVGSPGNGLLVQDGAEVTVSNSLIAAAWNAGLRVARGQNARVRVVDSDIRNCHYAGIVIGHGQSQAIVERCRISGSAWHGVRYDHASPTLASNLIFGNARCGIYASGRTAARVVGNVLWRNEMNGMACWFENRDHIVRNTFAANHREGLSVLGASGPLIEHNVFWNHTQAVYQGNISDPAPNAQASEILRLHENLFWHNPIPVASSLATDPEPSPQPVPIPLASFPGNLDVDPGFRDPDNGDFTLLEEGAAMKSGAGAPAPLPQASSWPLQPQEAAIIPAGDTRDYRLWKRPEPS